MKTRLLGALRGLWQFLTVIPGWPDAGTIGRTIYALPLVVPVLGLLALLVGNQFVIGPRMREVRAAHRPVLQLESEIAALRLECSDQQAAESAAATTEMTRQLIGSQEEFDSQLLAMQAAAARHGWVATLHANDPANDNSAGARLSYRRVRGRLVPADHQPNAFASLLQVLGQLPPPGRNGSLTRLTVRADDQSGLSVEFGVRYALRPPDEKTP